MALTDSQQSACDSFGRLGIDDRYEASAFAKALYTLHQRSPTIEQWLSAWGQAVVRGEKERAVMRTVHVQALDGNPCALAVVEQTVLFISTQRLTS